MKLSTKLRHVDIHNHWLRQEYSEKRVLFEWVSTKEMLADGLTKALPRQRHEEFVRLISLDDISKRLEQEKQREALRDKIIADRAEKAEGKIECLIPKGVKTRNAALMASMASKWLEEAD